MLIVPLRLCGMTPAMAKAKCDRRRCWHIQGGVALHGCRSTAFYKLSPGDIRSGFDVVLFRL